MREDKCWCKKGRCSKMIKDRPRCVKIGAFALLAVIYMSFVVAVYAYVWLLLLLLLRFVPVPVPVVSVVPVCVQVRLRPPLRG